MAADGGAFSLVEQLDPDLLLQVLSHIHAPHHVAIAGAVNRRLRHLCGSDILWRELCRRRWLNRLEAAAWLARAGETAPRDTQHGHWREHFARREHEISAHFPVFLMGGRLKLGAANGLHLFEPRYRRLVQIAMGRDRKFVFAVSAPTLGSIAYVCELHNVTVYADGRADVIALPVAECQLLSHSTESIAPNHPPLLWCFAEILPLPNEAVLRDVVSAQRALATVGQRGNGLSLIHI